MQFQLGELFSGPGGIALGAKLANINDPDWGIRHQWAVDYDADTVATYRSNICPRDPDSVIRSDIRALDYGELHERGGIDGLAFGFPCNDFSIVGERRGYHGQFGPLYTYGAKALREFQPQWFLAENVGGIRTANQGEAFKKIQTEFAATGYHLVTNLYRFEQYGVPQARHRVIIVGIREDLDVRYRVPSTEQFSNIDVSAETALTKPPITPDMTGTELARQSPTVRERLALIGPGQNVWNANLPEHLQINSKTTISQIYRRLHPARPSYTVTGSGGGGTHIYHWSEPRALTNRERARLQTFPDNFDFAGSGPSVRKQIGMAVPPRGAQIIFEALLRSFKGEEYNWQEPSLK